MFQRYIISIIRSRTCNNPPIGFVESNLLKCKKYTTQTHHIEYKNEIGLLTARRHYRNSIAGVFPRRWMRILYSYVNIKLLVHNLIYNIIVLSEIISFEVNLSRNIRGKVYLYICLSYGRRRWRWHCWRRVSPNLLQKHFISTWLFTIFVQTCMKRVF